MRVLHINYYDSWTGSGIAANRLHKALLDRSVDSRMLVMQKDSEDDTVTRASFPARAVSFAAQRISARFLSLQKSASKSPRSLNLFPNLLLKEIRSLKPDLVHLHWFGGEMFSIPQIRQIPFPLVWTLHDCWAFCGTEHCIDIQHGDVRYREGYTVENRPESAGGMDLDRINFEKKKRFWKDLHVHFCTPSAWMGGLLQESALFASCTNSVIPNCLDLDLFRKGDRSAARKAWNIPEECKVILFGAQNTLHPLKGMNFLREALKKLSGKEGCMLLSYGGDSPEEYLAPCGIKHKHAGLIRSQEEIISLYQTADVFVCPSVIDNFPNTVLEATACGVGVAAFRTAGLPEMVRHGENGYLCAPGNADDLSEGIKCCLQNSGRFSANARSLAEQRYAPDIVAGQYLKVYEKVLAG